MKFSPETHKRRDGLPFRIREDSLKGNFPIAMISMEEDLEIVIRLSEDGRFYRRHSDAQSFYDLIPITKPIFGN